MNSYLSYLSLSPCLAHRDFDKITVVLLVVHPSAVGVGEGGEKFLRQDHAPPLRSRCRQSARARKCTRRLD
jgi:hypothetical protein